ncbi:MAG TPA: helix-turn-helix domain-containing protein [Rubrobacteraceae bacterium]|jgi:cytoskeleton protein RodZ|nr:helix-turn-helix domain-containing protein [Rubrobacteraceae bacterium]
MPEGVPNGEAKIGRVLEMARKQRGLTLDEAEHATKIRKRYLDGLEREDFGVLPDAVYARGFLKTYANYLGLDGEELARQLKDRRRSRRDRSVIYGLPKTSDFDKPLINPGELTGKEGRTISWGTALNLLVALLLLAAVAGALYYVGLGAQSASENPDPGPPAREDAADNPQPRAGGAPEPDAPEAGAPENGAPDQPQPAQPQPETLSVVVSVDGDPSWLSVLADGRLAYEQIAQPGFSQTFEARREVSIKTGNAGAVGVEVNGQDLGKLGESGEVLTRDFTLKTAT